MTEDKLRSSLERLSPIQREAVEWQDGSILVLAGPGSGKTQALTCRVGRLLDGSRDQRFRVLALTFTNKVAREMTQRVSTFVPDLDDRVTIGTFHSFCEQVLRQHGVHLGIEPDFAIFSLDADREGVLRDAIRRGMKAGNPISEMDNLRLPIIDQMKAIYPSGIDAEDGEDGREYLLYRLYDEELRLANALDFNSLITETCRLFNTFPRIAELYQSIYPYWLVDELQDTNRAQFALIRSMSAGGFRNVFAVADDDQTIYEWNGANMRQVLEFAKCFDARVLQFPTNFRCPPQIVNAANRLAARNPRRIKGRLPAVAGRTQTLKDQIVLKRFGSEDLEREGIAKRILEAGRVTWGHTAILARSRRLVESMAEELGHQRVSYQIVKRRLEYRSPEMRWLAACLRLVSRPLDERTFRELVDSYNAFAGTNLDGELLVSRAESDAISFTDAWLKAAENKGHETALLDRVRNIERPYDPRSWDDIVDLFNKRVPEDGQESDLEEDLVSWRTAMREFNVQYAEQSVPRFLGELQPHTLEPQPTPHSVTVATIHGAKGREFRHVYLIGFADEVLPTFQSLQSGPESSQVDEERRNCFVAITRAQDQLTLSWAERYNGYPKAPSRFLREMGLIRG